MKMRNSLELIYLVFKKGYIMKIKQTLTSIGIFIVLLTLIKAPIIAMVLAVSIAVGSVMFDDEEN